MPGLNGADGWAGSGATGTHQPRCPRYLLKLTPEQRRQMVQQLSGLEANGTIPVEVAMRAAQRAKDAGASSDLA